MPARFHFDLVKDAEIIRDMDGVEATDIESAIEQAEICLREFRDAGELSGNEGWTLVIRDEIGTELDRLRV
ncbi:DUF6894 family protein [Methylobacterium brachythecii]|uniref:DUF6894 domain-containing protein n=1 Tax=Methylobacterium brachythecii TaxID=1176177 RepID=A0ABQ6D894_9HYPH|nr:hypothetical protein [Methylobacterium brachythecii]GLS44387.1 hypothetical protein GCM10007884_23750 [Methylobacterium brachythecii]